MALPPQLEKTHRYGEKNAAHCLELYVDVTCPFSAKQLAGVRQQLFPLIDKEPSKLSVVLRQCPQPWHAPSTLCHQALLAASRLAPTKTDFWSFVFDLWEHREDFNDDKIADETYNQTRQRLAKLTREKLGVDTLELLKAQPGNKGTAVDADLKLAVKIGRQNGIHVTPTVLLDGLIDPSVSSSHGEKEWKEFWSKLS